MDLQGSCACGKVKYGLKSHTPYPYNYCYCSICRKTNGSGGIGINIMGDNKSMNIKEGKELVKVYQSSKSSQRNFCSECGSHLWNYHPEYPDFIYPYASSIDTELPKPPHVVHLMVKSKAPWARINIEEGDKQFDEYPDQGIEQWHKKNNLYIE
ncbi:hypothetical protein AKO1_011031 [Acrasis kona]|uniref:CENP-V/GFA domain-containing protein n=1 Tax=Acrasis kona TaxID=1008807 RepID=A0AAW2YU47_9EUKA